MIKKIYLSFSFSRSVVAMIVLLLTRLPLAAQNDENFIEKKFDSYKQQVLHEKVFVHVDRSFYVAGEIIWFKVYCVNDENLSSPDLSKVAYIEVLDKDQQPVLQAKIALKDGAGSGSLLLPFNIHSGNYLLRSYTSWMKNCDPEFYFHQIFTVVNTIQTDTLSTGKEQDNYDVQFFPEGGDLVNELKSKVAFRATDNTGRGIDFTGVIADENNDTVIHFRPSKFGIGSFSFTPKNNKRYKAFITTQTGKVITQNITPPLPAGYVMNLSEIEDGRLKITVQTNTGNNFIYLFIHTGQEAKAIELINFTNGNAEFVIDKSRLGEGISHITLFDKNNQPVCERLYFKRPQQQLFIEAKTDVTEYLPRKKVTINLESKDEGNNAQAADMSMSVFLTDSLPLNYKDIYSYLWISSDLKGKVESPEYYLNNNTAEVNEALDNLMLTHGWRRFKWDEVLQEKKPVLKFLPEYEGHIVSGKIVNRANDSSADNMLAFLSVPGSHFQLYTAKSSSDGTVNFNTKDFYGTRLVAAMANSEDGTSYRVDLANPFSENFSSEKIPAFSLAKTRFANLLKRSINMQVQNVYTGSLLNSFEKLQTDSANFYGKPDAKYLLDNYTRFPTMQEVLREYVREIDVRKPHDKYVLIMLRKDEDENLETKKPVILLDGVPQFDNGNKITLYDPLKVRKLETINETYFLGPARFDGIASFTTYNGDVEGFQFDTATTVIDYEALQLRREFYHPAYETEQEYSSRMPDFRSLLYWSPDIKTNKKGEKEVSFYTSDVPGKYAVVIQGISQQGKSGSKVFMIDVKKN